jgi:hypothetical protein
MGRITVNTIGQPGGKPGPGLLAALGAGGKM